MIRLLRRGLLLVPVLAAGLLVMGDESRAAEDFPSRTVKIVVPSPAGGSLDVVARLIAEKLSKEWSQSVVIENHVGVNGGLGAHSVAASPPDGYTIMFATGPVFTTNKMVFKKLPYDPDSDFRPVSILAVAPNVLGINAKLPIKDIAELIEFAKAHPGQLTFASQGVASSGQLTGTLFDQVAGVDMRHVPYRGASLAWNDIIAGHVDMMWDGIPSILGQIHAGTIRALAVGSRERSPALPQVPTAIESGLPDFESESWFGAAVPRDTPDHEVRILSAAISSAIRSPDVAARILETGARPVGSTPEELAAYIVKTGAMWRKVIEKAHIQVE